MNTHPQRWKQLDWEQFDTDNQVPLCDVPRHFAVFKQSPLMMRYLATVLRLSRQGNPGQGNPGQGNPTQGNPRHPHSCEVGFVNGYGAIWLSLRGVQSTGYGPVARSVERSSQVNNLLGGRAHFCTGDPFDFFRPDGPRYDVIHHQDLLHHFAVPWIQAILAQQVAAAGHTVFLVPSVYARNSDRGGEERLLPIEEWERILAPFDIVELTYCGDAGLGERSHILCILRGQEVTDSLRSLWTIPAEPYPPGISAIVHTRNEARHIADCLHSLQGWTDEIIVCDMESEDNTVEIARCFTPHILRHPHIPNFDQARNASAMRARFRWIFYLDADERVPPGLGTALRALVSNPPDDNLPDGSPPQQSDEGTTTFSSEPSPDPFFAPDPSFAAVLPPFRHHFAGHWMRFLYPGYTAPRLLRNGRFFFNPRLHAGVQVDGDLVCFPAQDPELAIQHYSYESVAHYLGKLNSYTDGEAANMQRDGQSFHWQAAIRHLVQDFSAYYDDGNAQRDGVHGFLYSLLGGFYRFSQHAKLYEKRFHAHQLQPVEMVVPASVEQVLEYALSVVREKPLPQATAIRVTSNSVSVTQAVPESEAAQMVWSGPLLDPSGYGEESRHFLLGLDEAAAVTGLTVAAQSLPWSRDEAELTPQDRQRIQQLSERPAAPGFIQVTQNFPTGFVRHPQASLCIGRTMFETDRLPLAWVKSCNAMDFIWVPTQFNRQTFAQAGVAAEKLVVIPGCLDPAPYRDAAAAIEQEMAWRQERQVSRGEPFTFLSVFDWTRHKGWDVLLRAFVQAFAGRDGVNLVLKVWSTMGYSAEEIRSQSAAYLRQEMGHDLECDTRIRFVQEHFSAEAMHALYRSADAFVLPSRGEGWGRPYMEAMACGLPVIGTNWSGNLAFMTGDNSYLVDYELVAVPEVGWREIPTYRGHRWAEPARHHLEQIMLRVMENRDEATALARRGREQVLEQCDRKRVARLIADEIQRVRGLGEKTPGDRKPGDRNPDERKRDDRKKAATPSAHRPLRVRWEGAQFSWHSLAHVNRELCLGLLESAKSEESAEIELSIIPTERHSFTPQEDPRFEQLAARFFQPFSTMSGCNAPDEASGETPLVHVRHFFPPRLTPPEDGYIVLIQPWEYGYLPQSWIGPVQENVREVWCYSNYVRDVYRASGISEEKLRLIPLGVDTEVFHPQAPPYIFTTEAGAGRLGRREGDGAQGKEPFVFLFTGGTLHRKGIDILLEAYAKAFTPLDEVCLVIKDTGTRGAYYGQNERERILQLAQDESRPLIIYLDDDLSTHQLAGIYTAGDCLVQPYRGEGFCLPALEAMACGLPVIVPAGGPTDDFVDETVGWRVPAAKVPYPDPRIGEWECVGWPWMFEVDSDELARLMRRVFQNRDDVRDRGHKAARRVQENWTWRHSAEKIVERLQALSMDAIVQGGERTQQHSSQPDLVRQKTATERDTVAKETPLERESTVSSDGLQRQPGTISLCMIVRDEEAVLGNCLQSIRPWVDEIIVVDTGSTDRTVEIAHEQGAQVFHFPWCDDFSAARNESLRHASGEWIFWMDADDTIPESCGRQLRELAEMAEERVTGFLMQVHIPPAPGEEGFTVVDHVKLFRNRPELRFVGRIHEQILEAIHRQGGRIERTNLHVVHSGYDYSPAGQQKKRERDLCLLEKDLQERPDHPFVLFNIGMTAFHIKEFEKAEEALEKCLEMSGSQESTVRKVYAMLAGCRLEQGDITGAREKVEQGLKLHPHDPELLFRAGIVYREAGDLAAAERSYLKLLNEREVGHIDSLDVTMTGFKAHHNLALIYQDMGRLADAEAQFQAAVHDNPRFTPSWLGLGEVLLRLRRFDDARSVARQLSQYSPGPAAQLQGHIDQVSGHPGQSLPPGALQSTQSTAVPPLAVPVQVASGKSQGKSGIEVIDSKEGDSDPDCARTPDWERAPAFGRRETILRTLRRLHELQPGAACIVETGTLRDDRPHACYSDGWSTVAWAWYSAQTGGRAYTIDIDPQAIEACRRVTSAYAGYLEYVVADSLEFLQRWSQPERGEIHLLYLDSLDYFDQHRSEMHHQAEAQTIMSSLAPTCLVLIDDTTLKEDGNHQNPESESLDDHSSAAGLVFTGKGAHAVPFFCSQGFQVEWCVGGQVLLSRLEVQPQTTGAEAKSEPANA